MVERGANFTKRSFTLGGFALRSQVRVWDVGGGMPVSISESGSRTDRVVRCLP